MNEDKKAFLVQEYSKLRDDLVKTRDHMQRTFNNSLALASIIMAFFGFSKLNEIDITIVQTGVILAAIIFEILCLNYISNMRHYNRVSEYLAIVGEYVRNKLETQNELGFDFTKNEPIFAWEMYNAKLYYKFWSRIVFFFTWGSQSVFPLFSGVVAFFTALYIDPQFSFDSMINYSFTDGFDKILVIIFLFTFLLNIVSLTVAVIELFRFIGKSKKTKISTAI